MPTPETPATRPLAICIDDLALHAGVNAAAQALWEQGRVSTWSVLVDGPALPALAAWLHAHPHDTPELGLHLNLTEALPGARWVRPLKRLLADAWLRRLGDPAVLAAEIARQWDGFVEAFGRRPDFVDGHQHVHQLPGVREPLLALVRARCGQDARPWLRSCTAPALPWGQRFKPAVIGALGAAGLAREARRAGLRQNRHLLGVRAFDADEAGYLQRLEGWLASAAAQDLLMVHPARAWPGVDDPLMAAREAEYRVLASPAFGALLARERWRVQALYARAP